MDQQDKIINGNVFAKKLISKVKDKVSRLNTKGHRSPKLCVVLVGEDPASHIYVNKKHKKSFEAGIDSQIIKFDDDISETQLLDTVASLNSDNSVDGILVQLPLPDHINPNKVLEAIAPEKDVDGFHPINVGRLMQRAPLLRPCTPFGIINMLKHHDVELLGTNAVVVGASNIVGRPMALELLLAGSTVTVCHRFTKNLEDMVRQADLLVVGVGKPELIKGSWIKPGATCIDVGMNRLECGKLIGDIEFDAAIHNAGLITPVPGGVGPVTVAQLMSNTLYAFELKLIGTSTDY